jgi:DNA replication and repair protein RecF
MVLKLIELQNFRLHRNTSLEFSEKLNLIIGGNGQGKTSILEAIYYLSTTKNLNLAPDSEAVTFNENGFGIQGRFQDLTSNNSKIFFDSVRNKKSVFIDDKQVNKSSEFIGKFPIVSLIQSDHAITMGSPSERRRFVDQVISQSNHTYLEILLDYNKTLKQRSSLLSQIKETRNFGLLEQLDAWTESLINAGAEIIKHRINFIKEFNIYVKEAYNHIIESVESPEIIYDSLKECDYENIATKFREELEKIKEDELRRGVNLIGPHRDDFMFFINGLELKKYGSQGQHKTFQIALRFGQFFFMKDRLGKTPIFLMDDVFGELDKYRAGRISEYLSDVGQAFITLTDLTNTESFYKSGNNTLIRVENGKVSFA